MSRILVVQPPGAARDTVCATLRDAGYPYATASSGAEAVEVAGNETPELLLFSTELKAMDRWHAVKRLMERDSTRQVQFVNVGPELEAGDLLDKVASVVGPPPAPEGKATPAPRKRKKRAERGTDEGRILVVDDNEMNRDTLSRRLIRWGFEVEMAEDGAEALKMLDASTYDLVLLDVMMPGISGIEVLQQARETWSGVELPIIMATAKDQPEDIVEALDLGANDYVTKPLDFKIVRARVRTHLALRKAHVQLAASEARFRALLENTGDLITRRSLSGRLSYVSPASSILLGTAPEELVDTPFMSLLHPEDRKDLEALQRSGLLPDAFTFIARMKSAEGWIWAETSNTIIYDDEGARSEIQSASRDVSEHMERLGGADAALGGDVMEHPGWRGEPGLS